MADDKHYVPGDFYRICDVTGFKVRAKRTKMQWNNLIVREQSFEMRHPQDFVTGVRDDQNVPNPRPRQADRFIYVGTTEDFNSGGEFVVYGDNPGAQQFLVQNGQGPAYDTGLNSPYTNDGTAEIQDLNGTVAPVLQANYPGNGQGPSEE